ncbi:MAG: hypothetical protein OXG11_02535 [Chloroflexi bacterium]|nr:hypothetical protein [Chloroflexota bacterium]
MVERMNIRAALGRLVAIQGGLSITDPIAVSVGAAYKYVPRQSTTLPATPSWMNDWTLIREERHIDMRIQFYTVHMQLFVRDADQDQAADVASAFMEKTVEALDADVTLNGTVTRQSLRGGEPTLVSLERGGLSYIGLDLFLDLEMKEAKSFS